MRAGFSTVSLPGILENVMNKTLLDAYRTTPIVALSKAGIGANAMPGDIEKGLQAGFLYYLTKPIARDA